MKVYIYSTYKLSPVGFQIGTFEYTSENYNRNYNLSHNNDKDSSLVYQIFEEGFIKKAYGKMPYSEKYLILLKGYEHHYGNDHDEFGKIVLINIAFEFYNGNDYLKFLSGYNNFNEDELAKKMADFIVPDTTNKEYGLHIDASRFDIFYKAVRNKSDESPDEELINYFELEVNASWKTDYSEEIKEIFGFEFDRDENNAAAYFYPKKKFRTNHRQTNQNSAHSYTKYAKVKSSLHEIKKGIIQIIQKISDIWNCIWNAITKNNDIAIDIAIDIVIGILFGGLVLTLLKK